MSQFTTSRSSTPSEIKQAIRDYLSRVLPVFKYVRLKNLGPFVEAHSIKLNTIYTYLRQFEHEGWLDTMRVRTSGNEKIWTPRSNENRKQWEHDLMGADFLHALALELLRKNQEAQLGLIEPLEACRYLGNRVKPDYAFSLPHRGLFFVEVCRTDNLGEINAKLERYGELRTDRQRFQVIFIVRRQRLDDLPQAEIAAYIRYQDIDFGHLYLHSGNTAKPFP